MKLLTVIFIFLLLIQVSAQNNFFSDQLNTINIERLFLKNYETYSTVDLNNDGLDDFVCWPGEFYGLDYYQNTSTPDSLSIMPMSLFPSDLTIYPGESDLYFPNFCFFDIDYDGDLDFMTTTGGYIWDNPHYHIYLNSGDANDPVFSGTTADSLLNLFSLSDWDLYTLNAVDMDKDGQKELLTVYWKGEYSNFRIDLLKWQQEGDSLRLKRKPNFLKFDVDFDLISIYRIRSINLNSDSIPEIIISYYINSLSDEELFINLFFSASIISDSCMHYVKIDSVPFRDLYSGYINVIHSGSNIKEDFINGSNQDYYRQNGEDYEYSKVKNLRYPQGVMTFTNIPSGIHKNDLILVFTQTSFPQSIFMPDVVKNADLDYFKYVNKPDSVYYESLRPDYNLPSIPHNGGNEPVFTFADFDADGDLDIIKGDGNYNSWDNTVYPNNQEYDNSVLQFFENTGNDTVWQWQKKTQLKSSWDLTVFHPFAIDWDGDADYDLFVGHANKLYFVENIGSPQTPQFSGEWVQIDSIDAHYPCLFNYYGDKQKDLIVLNKQNKLVGYHNTGSKGTLDFEEIPGAFNNLNADNRKYKSVRAVDLNDDDKPDLLLGTWSTLYYSLNLSNVGIKFDDPKPVSSYRLFQNYPNPFNPSTTIRYLINNISSGSISVLKQVDLSIYNLSGQKITTLVSKKQLPGEYSIQWRPFNLPSGVYFYRLIIGNSFVQRKMILLH